MRLTWRVKLDQWTYESAGRSVIPKENKKDLIHQSDYQPNQLSVARYWNKTDECASLVNAVGDVDQLT